MITRRKKGLCIAALTVPALSALTLSAPCLAGPAAPPQCVILNVGRGPRDYLKTNLQYDFAKFTALTLSYEYGRLPPNFTLVNHKYSLGLLLKFKTTFVQK